MDLNGKALLVTGGTGSFGKKFIQTVIERYPDVKRVVVYSRDELKQFEMAQTFSTQKYPFMRYFIGDIRDEDRFKRACEGIDIIVHAAALKQVPTAEYNPMECIKTNVNGAYNVIQAALSCNIKKVVALSTDKAAAPINLYGATKLCSDKLFIAANNMKGRRDLSFSVVRYGNVMGSRGSVIPFFMKKQNEGTLPITDTRMTRFNISLIEGVEMVIDAINNAWGGEIFVPKIPSYRITDVATAIAPNAEQKVVGIRPGEKIHEEMITSADSYTTVDLGKYYAILPQVPIWNKEDYMKHFNAKDVEPGFKYNSGTNSEWLTVEEIRNLITEHVDPDFSV
ncbi:UDP-N-acetylglucosamine 4,6-dehydratase (inverting) [Aureispira anguillae]|uniref:UDP-N-acetylglucosamine 4,6-dehydratase (Inverting) n=2 Tax=Aureispira anguillae TaxID=2864201 RepID=A0A915YJI5_9BACT|nr:UDP-N-acetylglucosamine 4,6-dehydratase (inverting) [Aureispira anguillae]BDS14375.1 UDP-N-acetylglucosamine 4,6-dehydratase (inverting) [Aureispira anguillae]